ncbi:MAG: response regulator [Acidobacteria bacterium]|nr:response regulator [Acidobacteriota bacterium]
MESNQRIAFIDEAETKLRMVRNVILVSRQEGRPASIDLAATISVLRREAERLELGLVVSVLATVESDCSELSNPDRPISDAEARAMLDMIAYAEAEVVKLRFSHDDRDMGAFVEESFDVLIGPPDAAEFAAEEPAANVEEDEDEFEPDAEMLEIFSMEADELLANIESNLARLAAAPSDREALWEIRRHAHTFKGAAGIIGLKKPSSLAHRIEDLLDRLAQNETAADTGIVELITEAAVCLRALTAGDSTPVIAARTAAVYAAFDKAMSSVSEPAGAEVEVPASVAIDLPQVIEVLQQPLAEVAVTPVFPAVPSNEEISAPVPDPAAARRPIVRVAINRLDNLVRVARDLVVSRSAVEQRMAGLDAQLDALAKTTRRLQAAHAKIENDFEASMLRSYVPRLFSRPGSSTANGNSIDVESFKPDQFDSLEFDRYTDFHESTRELSESIQDCFSIGTSLEALKASLETVIEDQRRLIEETQEKVMQIRLIKFESLATRLQRAVKVACEEERKDAEIILENPNAELDTDVLDLLVEPLIHLIRNAVVHGIEPPETRRLLGKPETGRIGVWVANQETHIELKVSDDGRGINSAALRARAAEAGMLKADDLERGADLISLLALPGLTTAAKLTMNAGRGVGMGIVKESVAARGGTLTVETAQQMGTTFTIKVPLAFAVTEALLVRSERKMAAVPFKTVKRIVEIAPADLRWDGPNAVVEMSAGVHPVCWLSDHFSHKRHDGPGLLNALLIETDDTHFVLIVDEILKTEEVAVKPLGKPLDRVIGVMGAAILGNGDVAPVLDVSQLAAAGPRKPAEAARKPEPVEKKTVVLVVDDSPSVRHMTSKVVTAAGWTALTAKDGVDALEVMGSADQLPDVILSDVEMPRMDGYELAAALRVHETFREIPLVFITSRAGDKHREKAEELGVTEYLTKPFLDAELIGTVERLALVPVPA